MNEPLFDRDVGDDSGAEVDSAPPPRAPRWVTALAVAIAILLILTLVVLHLAGAVGPGAH